MEKSLENNRDEAWRDAVKEAHLVSDEATISPGKEGEGLKKPLDLGIITSVTGTPSKMMIQEPNHISSPIIGNRRLSIQ